jgi:hypothetical protein
MPVIEDNEKIAFDAGDQSGRIEFSLSDRSLSRIPLLPPTLDWGGPFIHNHSMWLSQSGKHRSGYCYPLSISVPYLLMTDPHSQLVTLDDLRMLFRRLPQG